MCVVPRLIDVPFGTRREHARLDFGVCCRSATHHASVTAAYGCACVKMPRFESSQGEHLPNCSHLCSGARVLDSIPSATDAQGHSMKHWHEGRLARTYALHTRCPGLCSVWWLPNSLRYCGYTFRLWYVIVCMRSVVYKTTNIYIYIYIHIYTYTYIMF